MKVYWVLKIKMLQQFPEEIALGNIFNGKLRVYRNRYFYVQELQDESYDSNVKTMMGWQDLPCLSFDDLIDKRRYRFEIVYQNQKNSLSLPHTKVCSL